MLLTLLAATTTDPITWAEAVKDVGVAFAVALGFVGVMWVLFK